MSGHGIATLVAAATQSADLESTAAALPSDSQAERSAAIAAPAATPPGKLARFRFAAFAPAVAAAVALAVHRWVPSQQTTNPTHLYPRFLLIVLVAGVVIGLTQVLWRRVKPTPWNFPLAFASNALHWCVVSAPVLAAGILLICAW